MERNRTPIRNQYSSLPPTTRRVVADAMNAAWGGISNDTQITMCLSAGHKTVKNILKRGAFTVSMADEAHVAACDYVGIVSANDVPDKLKKAGFHTTKASG